MVIQTIDPQLKESIEAISKTVAILGGLIAASIAIYQLYISTKQRKRELRWQQTNKGKELVDCMFDEQKSSNALTMIDSPGKSFQDIPGDDKRVGTRDLLKALEIEKIQEGGIAFSHNDERSIYIRECFDELFYYLERFEYFIENELVTFDDVKVPAEYYVKKMGNEKEHFLDYSRAIGYHRAVKFMEDLAQKIRSKKPPSNNSFNRTRK